jgi:hypothetical protein
MGLEALETTVGDGHIGTGPETTRKDLDDEKDNESDKGIRGYAHGRVLGDWLMNDPRR